MAKTKEQIDKEVKEQIALLLQGYDPRLVADVSKEDFELPDDIRIKDLRDQDQRDLLMNQMSAEAIDAADTQAKAREKALMKLGLTDETPDDFIPPKTLDEQVEEAMNSNIFNVKNLYDHKNREGGTSDVARALKDIPGFVPGFSMLPPFKGQEKDASPIGLYSGLSEPGKRIMEFQPEGPSYYPYRNELLEDKPDPVAKKIKEVNDEIRRIEVANDTRIQADYKALARKQDALWQYAVYRAANGDTSLFDKLVGDAEARREAERNREFQAAEAEKNRQSAERQSAGARSEADRSEFVSAKKKAERALQDLNDINDSTRAKWANGSATSDDVLNLRRAYRAYQYALDDAEAAARKISEAYDSGDIFDKTTGDLGINLDAMKGLDFNGVYTGERNLPYTATMASNVVSSKQISDALNSADPEKAKESSLMLGNELEKFNTSHPSNMGLEEIQRIQNLFQDKIDQLNAVTAPTTNQKRRTALNKSAENEQLAWDELQPKLNLETNSANKQQMVDKHNRTYGSNRTLIKPRKNK